MTISSKRAEYISLASLILSVIFFIISLLLGRWSGFFPVYAVSWLILSAGLIWLVLLVQFHQRALAEQEKLDMSQMEKSEHTSGIFQSRGEHDTLLAVTQRRLQMLEKWFLPFFSVAIAVYEIVVGFYLLKSIPDSEFVEPKQPLLCAISMTAIAFVSFVFSRYSTGMSREMKWKPLRAGGGITFAGSVVCFVLAVALSFAKFDYPLGIRVINYVIPVLLIVLGAETGLNVILNLYRPRIKGQYNRAAFDSRLLGIINEPGEILHTVAGTIDYQFGFEVSQTWFYKLLSKAIIPLLLFAAVILYLSSSIVVLAPMDEAIVEHFGNPLDKQGEVRQIGPGLHIKYPWLIDEVRIYPTKKISEISIGFVPESEPWRKEYGHGPLLWGQSHYKEEYNLLVASKQTSGDLFKGAAPVSLVCVAVPVQYRVKNLYEFLYGHEKPEKILEAICYRELTRFAASTTIEVDTEQELEQSLLGAGRSKAKKVLTERIQRRADEAGIGVEIVFLGLQGIHPPPESNVAKAYQEVIGAVQKRQALVLNAEAQRNSTLSELAGSVDYAEMLYELASEYLLAENNNEVKRTQELAAQFDRVLRNAGGNIFKTLREAESYAFEREILSRATSKRFEGQIKAYRAAPEIYKHEQRLSIFDDAITDIRKFVLVADPDDKHNFVIDLQEKLTPDLYDITGIKETSGK